jgi:hypothetical protein
MPDIDATNTATVDPVIIDAINQSQSATMGATQLTKGGAGRAYQVVAASAAIAIQDATDMLRNASTVSTTAIGVALAQMLEGNPEGRNMLDAAQNTLTEAVKAYSAICAAASQSLKDFPAA